MLNKEQVLELGFKELPHKNLLNSLVFDLDRRRHLSIGCLGTPNEMMYVCEVNMSDDKQIDDLVCIWNYDYDGYLTLDKLTVLLSFLAEIKTNNYESRRIQ